MKKLFLAALFAASAAVQGQSVDSPIDLTNWKLELPTGYKASDWKLSNFQNDRFAKPFFYLDSIDGALTMEAYPAEGTSSSKYIKNSLREQMQPGNNDVNWTLKQGGLLEAEFQVAKMSQEASGKYHRTLLFQIDGRTSEKQTKELRLEKPLSMPFLKVYWQNEQLRITRRVLKDESTVGDALLQKDSWKEDDGVYSQEKIGFEKVKIRIEARKGKILIQINEEKPIIFRDLSVTQWYFENYFNAGNYLQTTDENGHSIVKYYQLKVTHTTKK